MTAGDSLAQQRSEKNQFLVASLQGLAGFKAGCKSCGRVGGVDWFQLGSEFCKD